MIEALTPMEYFIRYILPIIGTIIVVSVFILARVAILKQTLKRELQHKGEDVLGKQATRYKKSTMEIESIKEVLKRNDLEHSEIYTTMKVLVMGMDKVLDVLRANANGKSEEIDEVRAVLKDHMYDKTTKK